MLAPLERLDGVSLFYILLYTLFILLPTNMVITYEYGIDSECSDVIDINSDPW
jgi:hypothetical protein